MPRLYMLQKAKYFILFLVSFSLTLLLIYLPAQSNLQLIGASLLLLFWPGWSLLNLLFLKPNFYISLTFLLLGSSYASSLLIALYLIYLPGEITQTKLIGSLVIWVMTLYGLRFLRDSYHLWSASSAEEVEDVTLLWGIKKTRLVQAGLLILLLGLALSLRYPLLGYSEFHEDEIEINNLALRIISGEEYALFLHRKGPIQTLLPLVIWLNTGWVTEFISRFTFMLASVFGVGIVYVLTESLSNRRAAISAALLLTVNGLSIAFGRLVQYQALLLFLGPLTVWVLWYAYQKRAYQWSLLASILFAVCTLAHYDALLYLPILGYLILLLLRQAHWRGQVWGWLIGSGLLYLGLILSFYVPYMRDPQFTETLTYLRDARIGDELLYNNLALLVEVDRIYNSRFYLPLLFCLSFSLLLLKVSDQQKSLKKYISFLVLMTVVASTYWWPKTWRIDGWNLAFIPWTGILAWGWWHLRKAGEGYRLAWIWWLSSWIAYVFFVDKPGTHFYIAYPAWTIVAGLGVDALWTATGSFRGAFLVRVGQIGLVIIGGSLIILFFFYQTMLFWQTASQYQKNHIDAWTDHAARDIYQTMPERDEYFGSPKKLGWKVAGVLLEQGRLANDYRTANELFIVPVWYTYRTPRSCYTDPQTYFVTNASQGQPELGPLFTQVGEIITENQPRITIYRRGDQQGEPKLYQTQDYEPLFDQQATLKRFTQPPQPQYPLAHRFGQIIEFQGYDLAEQTFQPGETIILTLHWQSLQPTEIAYRAFVHLEKGQIWGQHDETPACRLPTSQWRSGQIARGQFRVPIDPATPPDIYPLTIGLYNPEDWQRLPIFNSTGQEIGNFLHLTDIQVQP